MKTKILTAALASSLLVWGCSNDRTRPLDPPGGGGGQTSLDISVEGVRATAQKNLEDVLLGMLEAEDITSDSDAYRALGLSIGGIGEGSHDRDRCGGDRPTEPGNDEPLPEPGCNQTNEDAAQERAETLVDQLMDADNVEEATPTRITFLLDATDVCDALASAGEPVVVGSGSIPGSTPGSGSGTTEPGSGGGSGSTPGSGGAGDPDDGHGGDEPGPDQPDDGGNEPGRDEPGNGGAPTEPGDAPTEPGDARVPPRNDPNVPTPDPAPATPCEEALADYPVRLAVSSRTAGDVDAAILVGDTRTRAGTLAIHRDELTVDLDLGAAKTIVEAMSSDVTDRSTLSTVQGRVTLRLRRDSADRYSVEVGIPTAIRIASTGDEPFSLAVAASSPALSLSIDTRAEAVTVATNVGQVDVSGPLGMFVQTSCEDFAPGPNPTPGGPTTTEPSDDCDGNDLVGNLQLTLAALRANVAMSSGSDALQITDLSIGNAPFRVLLDGAPLLSTTLNANRGGAVDATMGDHAKGTEMKVKPAFNVTVDLDLSALSEQIEVPTWAINEQLQVTFDGAAEPALVAYENASPETRPAEPIDPSDPDDDRAPVPPPPEPEETAALEVLAGTLTFRARSEALITTVPAGSCLYGDFDAGDVSDPVPVEPGGEGSGGGSDDPEPAPPPNPEPASSHPFANLRSGPCN